MSRSNYPSAANIRAALLLRAASFRRKTGMPLSAIGKNAINDSAFLFAVAEGRNLTLRTYQRVMDWIDQNQPERLYARQKKKSTSARGARRR